MSSNWNAGIASTIITPDESMWLAGYAKRTKPSQGKATELFTKALALEDAVGNRLVIVNADLIAMPREIADWISAQCEQRFGLRREQLLLTTSHTHSGPEVRPSKAYFFEIPEEFTRKIPGYVEQLQERMVQTIGNALGDLKPSHLYAGQSHSSFAANRRGTEGSVDRDVPVLRITDAEGKIRAILFSYACHNTTLWDDSYVYCGDYAGFAQQYLQESFPGATAMFMCGAAADQNPEPLGTMENARAHGRELAEAVKTALKETIEIEPELNLLFENVPFEFQQIPSREQLAEQTRSSDRPTVRKAHFLLNQPNDFGPTYPCPVQAVRLGRQVLLIAIGGEPVAEYSIRLKEKFSGSQSLVWVVGYANDMFGYVPTLRIQREGGYEGGRAMLWSSLPMPWTESVEPRMMSAFEKIAEDLRFTR
ncbi:MAG TPA: neutral/alkaline non-lysosomal ceramidase N-terminal domain-containing protein [Tepidisphaeraceae bacterium]|nr:neutral/alkaline non-lysosomal ceramidase N-terminal domain-containing protein [Tepidisphaeraceae bacterium]